MTLWRWGPPEPGAPSLDPPPITLRNGERGRTGANSTRLHTRRYPQRVHNALDDEADHEIDRRARGLIRRSIAKVIHLRSTELGPPACVCHLDAGKRCPHLETLWAGYGRRFSSCDYAKVFRNDLRGTQLAIPFSCRVPGCPHCEGERVDELRRRFLPLVEAAAEPKAVTLTIKNPPAGYLDAGWSTITAGVSRLRRSPLFAGVEHCTTPKQRGRRHAPGETCAGHHRRCRAGKVGCLAGVTGDALELRRWCAGRCHRLPRGLDGLASPAHHPACRPCPGHAPVRAALLALETTVNRRAREWHPHANLLYDGPFIAKHVLADAWAAAVRAPTAHVWIRDARRAPSGRGDWTVKKTLYETLKYAVKADTKLVDSAAPGWFVEWVEARRGRRLVRSYGAWHGVADVDDEGEPSEQTVPIIDDDGRTYRLPALDPLFDDEADWVVLPGDAPRAGFLRVKPPDSDTLPRRPWLIAHRMFAVELEAVPDG